MAVAVRAAGVRAAGRMATAAVTTAAMASTVATTTASPRHGHRGGKEQREHDDQDAVEQHGARASVGDPSHSTARWPATLPQTLKGGYGWHPIQRRAELSAAPLGRARTCRT